MRSVTVRLGSATVMGVLALTAFAGCGDKSPVKAADVTTQSEPTSSATPTTTPSPTQTTVTEQPVDPDVQITLDTPTEGADVHGSLAVSGTANSPEATVPWTITDASGATLAMGSFTAEGWMDKLYPFSGTVDVSGIPAGDYTFSVAVADMSDGESGKEPQHVDRAIHIS